ncbi:helix-turn-helix transcriptional regulator [Natronosporangium hydrolyticum]|uniref:Helix-turn-helix transcriptional regulator n=1 Tax=Natronosporangium hydrolyticum TaxID=2811111 RepID=A0A895YI16_9ACTN|nr:helix-turn-helix transcriptional regulator [Natronosporangium hydrolyticum]QSB15169.1 helix-turn-helix transcriptional regulator [Natronosporangium hydrolyticum]
MNEIYDPDQLGPLLARLRQERGYSQRTLAERLCDVSRHPTLTRHDVSRWERQERMPTEFWLGWLAEVLGVSPDLLRLAAGATREHHTATVDGVRIQIPPRLGRHTLWEPPGYPVVSAWLTLAQGPKETVIALSGVEVDQLRTVLAPINPPEHEAPATVDPVTEESA